MRTKLVWAALLLIFSFVPLCAERKDELLTMDQVMTPDEMKAAGIAGLSPAQRQELDRWLNSYTSLLVSARKRSGECDPAIETKVDGEFEGWKGETIYKLMNGQIWQQASYHYHYHYAYAPDVTIYSSSAGCLMRVADDNDDPILVRRLK